MATFFVNRSCMYNSGQSIVCHTTWFLFKNILYPCFDRHFENHSIGIHHTGGILNIGENRDTKYFWKETDVNRHIFRCSKLVYTNIPRELLLCVQIECKNLCQFRGQTSKNIYYLCFSGLGRNAGKNKWKYGRMRTITRPSYEIYSMSVRTV